jgi:protein O-GlcNAc transferase
VFCGGLNLSRRLANVMPWPRGRLIRRTVSSEYEWQETIRRAQGLYAAGRLREVVDLLEAPVRENAAECSAMELLGSALFQLGRIEEGRRLIERALSVDPRYARAWNSLGLVHHLSGDNEEALAAFERATEADPEYGEAWVNLGFVLQALGRQQASLDMFRRALATGFRSANLHLFLGNALAAVGEHEEALSQYDASIAMKRDLSDAWNNRGNSLLALNRQSEAAESLNRAIELMAASAETPRAELAHAYQLQGRWRDAIATVEGSPEPELQFAGALTMPAVFESQEMVGEALQHLREGLARLRERRLHLQDPMRQVGLTSFNLPYFGMSDREIQEEIARIYLEACPNLGFQASHTSGRSRPRIGVASAMLKRHSVSLIFGGLIERLDRDRFELVYLQAGTSDVVSDRLATRADRHVMLPSNLREAQKAIAQEELDVLFFPEVGADPLTYYLAFGRFAPVQCATWGHPLTTGSPAIDFFISSKHLEREDGQSEYTERLVCLDHLSAYYSKPESPPEWPRSEFELPEDRRLYGCLQTAYKFHPEFDPVLAEILRRDDRGTLLLAEPDRSALKEIILARWRRSHPVIAERALWLPQLKLDHFQRVLQLCNALLVPIQFGAGRSALDALSVGAPLVTLKGPYLKSRITYAAYREMGMEELVADSEEAYIDLALRLANDVDFREQMRQRVAEGSAPLYESEIAVREFNRFFASVAPS